MHVINDCGAWERQDLELDCERVISREDAYDLVPTAEVDSGFVDGLYKDNPDMLKGYGV